MNPKEVLKDGRVFGVTNIEEITREYLNPSYGFEPYPNARCTESMHLVAGRLIPTDSALPSFIFRWDEKQGQCDVDIENVSKEAERAFKSGKNGYAGHQPTRRVTLYDQRMYVKISTPDMMVYEGVLKIGVLREVAFNLIIDIDVNPEGKLSYRLEREYQKGTA